MQSTTMPRRQRGTSMVEALVAFVVLSLGLLGMARLQSQLRLNGDVARQRSEALRVAQDDMETLRAFAVLPRTPGLRSYAEVAASSRTLGPAEGWRGNTSFRLERRVDEGAGYRSASVDVHWTDRSGADQHVLLQSAIAGAPPALSGALVASAGASPVHTVRGRSALIPLNARNLGDGRSVFKPSTAGSIAFVFDNASGNIIARCTGIAAGRSTESLSAADLTTCSPDSGLLLSGVVRASLGDAPDAAHASDAPPAFTLALLLAGEHSSTAPICVTEAKGAVVAYHCVVTPLQERWSGRSTLVPQGWTLGTSASDRKVCRYSADQDGSGAVDSNAEHPRDYLLVDRTLMQQNFLIIRGDLPCPAARGEQVDLATVQHQP
jgi:Tfp pilus assembly protein PilV